MKSSLMPHCIALSLLLCAGVALQGVLIPAFTPRVLQPDIFLLMGISVLAFASLDFGFTALFVCGVAGDLLGSGRTGLLPLCYLLSAAAILHLGQRELTRGHLAAPWIAGLAATVLAQLLYAPLSAVFGTRLELGLAMGRIASLAIAACVWGLPVAYVTGALLYKLQLMSPQVHARWSNNERASDAQRRQAI